MTSAFWVIVKRSNLAVVQGKDALEVSAVKAVKADNAPVLALIL